MKRYAAGAAKRVAMPRVAVHLVSPEGLAAVEYKAPPSRLGAGEQKTGHSPCPTCRTVGPGRGSRRRPSGRATPGSVAPASAAAQCHHCLHHRRSFSSSGRRARGVKAACPLAASTRRSRAAAFTLSPEHDSRRRGCGRRRGGRTRPRRHAIGTPSWAVDVGHHVNGLAPAGPPAG